MDLEVWAYGGDGLRYKKRRGMLAKPVQGKEGA
jgi:hypothetical protein